MNPDITIDADGRLRLRYRLHELPSAQHKAGLAGLLFHAKNMQSRGLLNALEIHHLSPNDAVIVVDADALKATFDDLYDSCWQEESRNQVKRKKNKTPIPPKRIDEFPDEDNPKKAKKLFIYDDFRPSGKFFSYLLESSAESLWIKLWRDMLWAVLRAQPATRGDYEARANGEPIALLANTQKALLNAAKGRAKNKLIVDSVAGSLFVGAQAVNAERVSFQGTVELNFLLQFWPLVTPIFAPRRIDKKEGRMMDYGYLLAIPEVCDLEGFLDDIEAFWRSRTAKKAGFRPEQAVIDVPQEGGLEFLYDLAHLRADKTTGLSLSVSGVEWFHQDKQRDSVRMHGQGRIRADRALLRRYEDARQRHCNPLFKHLTLGNLLADQPWHQGAANLLALQPVEFFIHTAKTPRFPFFGVDARRRFNAVIQDLKAQENIAMSQTKAKPLDEALVARVYQLIGAYVEHRAHEKSGKRRRDFKKGEDGKIRYPKDLREAVEKVTKDAFLAMRGRNDREFVAYFTGTICSVPQFFGRQEDFITLSQALIGDPDLIKDLSMLALSAHSWMPGAETDESAASADNADAPN